MRMDGSSTLCRELYGKERERKRRLGREEEGRMEPWRERERERGRGGQTEVREARAGAEREGGKKGQS